MKKQKPTNHEKQQMPAKRMGAFQPPSSDDKPEPGRKEGFGASVSRRAADRLRA